MIKTIRIGTRGSTLAMQQTNDVVDRLRTVHPQLEITVEVITSRGDEFTDIPLTDFGSIGAFTSTLERPLRSGSIDLAVHSYKDLPTKNAPGAVIGAVPHRANPADVLISRSGCTLETLPEGGLVGTGSRRRAAQLLHHRPDLRILDIRGNVDTRLNKAFDPDGDYDAILLAYAGLERLGRLDVINEILPLDVMLPAPAQAAVAVQCRDESEWLELLKPLNDFAAECAVAAERAFLSKLEAGCSMPVAAYGSVEANLLRLTGRVISTDGKHQIEVNGTAPFENLETAQQLGEQLAEQAKSKGAVAILESVR